MRTEDSFLIASVQLELSVTSACQCDSSELMKATPHGSLPEETFLPILLGFKM